MGLVGRPGHDPGVVMGCHLDSVPDGGAFDGPLGVVSALATVDALRAAERHPARLVGVVNFVDEEGARFGVACAGSRIITGALDADRARGLTDADGITMAEAWRAAGRDPAALGPDETALRRVHAFVELHVEQGGALALNPDGSAPGDLSDATRAVAIGTDIWPHGRWRIEIPGEANHAGTTRLEDRRDAMLGLATIVQQARAYAAELGCVATVGKVRVEPGGVNAVPSHVTAWLDARGPAERAVRATVAGVLDAAGELGGAHEEESWTPTTRFDAALASRLTGILPDAPLLGTERGTTRASLPPTGSPPRCSSSATRRESRTHPPSSRSLRTATVGSRAHRSSPALHVGPSRPTEPDGGSARMTTFWCESAFLTGGFAKRVRLVVSSGLFKEVFVDADPEPGDVILEGVTLPGMANTHSHAFHRALRGRVNGGGGNFWNWREQMYASRRPAQPGHLPRARPRRLRGDGARRLHPRRRVPLRAPPARRQEVRRPQRDGLRRAPAADEAGIRMTLLDTCYLEGGLNGGGYVELHPGQRRFSDGSVDAWAERMLARRVENDRVRLGAAIHSIRAVRRRTCPRSSRPRAPCRCTSTCPSSPARTCLPDVLRVHTHGAARRGRRARPQPDEHPRHPPDGARHRAARWHGHGSVLLPHDRAGPRRWHRARPGAPRRRHPALLGSDQHVVIDPFGGAARHRDARAARDQRAGPVHTLRPAPGGVLQRLRALGWSDGGTCPRGRSPTSSPCGPTRSTPPARPGQIIYSGVASDVSAVVVGGDLVVRDGQHRLGDVGRLLGTSIERVVSAAVGA